MTDPTPLPYSHAAVLAPYLDRSDVDADFSHGAILVKHDRRALDVSSSDGVWRVVRLDGDDMGDAIRVVTRADLDAHVSWVAGEAG